MNTQRRVMIVKSHHTASYILNDRKGFRDFYDSNVVVEEQPA